MGSQQSKSARVADHASRGNANAFIVMGAVVVALGAVAGAVGAFWGVALALPTGGSLLGLGVWQRRSGVAAQLANTASGAVTAGRFAEAEALLVEVEATRAGKYFQRFVELQRALIAMRRGALEEVVARSEPALALPVGRLNVSAAGHRAELLALHALACAGLGRRDAARADVAALRADPHVLPSAVARGELAEAMVLERAGERAALRQHLAQKRFVLLEYTTPRERAVVRAYQHLLRAQTTTPYREPAPDPGERAEEEPTLGDWVARVAPAAARFVRDKPQALTRAPLPLPSVDPAVRVAAQERLPPVRSQWRRVLVLWAVLVVMFLGVWHFFSAPRAPIPPRVAQPVRPPAAASLPIPPAAVALVVLAVFVAVFAAVVLVNLRAQRRMAVVHGLVARGDLDAVMDECRRAMGSRYAAVAAHGAMWVSWLLARNAEWAESLAVADRAIAKVRANEAARVASSDLVLPALHAQRAVALQALGRGPESDAELALIYGEFSAYPLLPVTHYRVALVGAARRGDLAEVARLGDQASDDLSISVREELLADLACAACRPGGTSAAEVERLGEELRDDPHTRRWVEALCPTLLSRFQAAYSGGTEA